MILNLNELPAEPEADRILVRPEQPRMETDTGRLVIPETAATQAHAGTIMAAGLKARDIMYDNGQEIGDTIWYGQFAGVWEEWDHIVKAGKDPECQHESWDYEASLKIFRGRGYKCRECGALRQQEPLLFMNVGDILANVDKARRFRAGQMELVRRETQDGKTCHLVERPYAATITSTLSNRIERTTNGAS